MTSLFSGIFDTSTSTVIAPGYFLLCLGVSFLIGLWLAGIYAYRSRHTQSFMLTLALLPAIVCVVIMMVNGNIGAAVGVAGAFSLVRFRSVAGSAKDIAMIFLAMAAGLIVGMGYLAYAILFALLVGAALFALVQTDFGSTRRSLYRNLRVTIPEDLDYTDLLGDIFKNYCRASHLVSVKTSNMGSLFKLTYDIELKDPAREKEMLDAIRVRNGNLEITVSQQEETNEQL